MMLGVMETKHDSVLWPTRRLLYLKVKYKSAIEVPPQINAFEVNVAISGRVRCSDKQSQRSSDYSEESTTL